MTKSNGKLENFLGVEKIDPRFFNWLCFYVCLGQDRDYVRRLAASENKYECVFLALDNRSHRVMSPISVWENGMVLSRDIEWLENDKRFFEWFVCELDFDQKELLRKNPLNLSYRDLCVSVADLESSRKTPIPLERRRRRWDEVKCFKNVISWVEGDEEERKIEFISRVFKREGFRVPELGTIRCFDDFLLWLDCRDLRRLEVENISAQAKRSWQQQNYRGDKSKRKQINIMLDVDVVQKLEILTAKHHLSKAKVVQVLLEEECSRHLYISKRRADMAKGEI